MVATVAGGIASAVVGSALSRRSGGRAPAAPRPGSVFAPGLSLVRDGRDITVERDPALTGLFGRLGSLAEGQAGRIGGLLGQVRPGFSALRASRLAGLEDNRVRAIGNLRENLARRRVSGSSFANDALSRAELEFQREGDRIRSESLLQELDMTNRLMTQQYETLSSAFQSQIQQLNLEATLGANYASGVQANLTNIFNTQSQLAAQNAAGAGQFFAPAINAVGDAVSGAVSNFFTPSQTQPVLYNPSQINNYGY